jgi:hypothetical protein
MRKRPFLPAFRALASMPVAVAMASGQHDRILKLLLAMSLRIE